MIKYDDAKRSLLYEVGDNVVYSGLHPCIYNQSVGSSVTFPCDARRCWLMNMETIATQTTEQQGNLVLSDSVCLFEKKTNKNNMSSMCVCVCTLNDKRKIKHEQSAPVLYYISRCIVSLWVCGKRDMCNMSGAPAVGILLSSTDIFFYFCIRSSDILLYFIDGYIYL